MRKEEDEGGGKRVADMKRFKYIVKLFERKGWREKKCRNESGRCIDGNKRGELERKRIGKKRIRPEREMKENSGPIRLAFVSETV